MSALIVFIVFLVGIFLSIPIAISMMLGSAAPLLLDTGVSIAQLVRYTYGGANSTPILAVPLFILGGVIMAEGGISKRLFNFFAYFVGRLRGGVPCAVVLTCLFYGAISGSGPATTAAVGSMTIPFMNDLGYEKKWSAGLIATSGGLGVIIPPSIPFVLYSLATGESTTKLFLAGVLPGILIGFAMMIWAVISCRKNGEDPERVKARVKELKAKGFWNLFKESFFALLCPIIVLGGIYSGIVTPTEAACISVFYALIVSLFVYRSVRFKDLWRFLCAAVKTYAGLAMVLAFATAFGRVLAMVRATDAVTAFITANFHSTFSVTTVLVILFLILGMVMDTGPAIIILAPILLPACKALGMDGIHLGVILVCCLSIGLVTPPFGLDLFVAGTLSDQEPMAIAKKALPFMLAFAIALLLVAYIPQISLVLL